MTVSFLDRFMLALCIFREARGESNLGKALVGQVILNRVKDTRWPNTIRDVVVQPKQFSAFNAGDPNAVIFPKDTDPAWQDSLEAAQIVLSAQAPLTPANHYHTVSVNPTWAKQDKVTDREGHHIFYEL